MSMTLTLNGRETLKRVLPIVALATAMLLVAGFVYLSAVNNVEAAKPSDYGLKEGDTISAAGSDDPDVYIVNDPGYKRLFLNPVIFGFYGHLGGFAKVKSVTPATRDAFPTSGLFRNCETNDEKVYGVETTGEDTGMLHWVNTSGSQAVADDANFFLKVFCVNNNEFNWYAQGSAYTSVNQVPNYARIPGQTPSLSPVAGNVGVSLASSNPAAQTITKNAYGAVVMALRFSGTGKVQELTFKRSGAGDTADYDNLFIYDGVRRLTGGRSPSSSDGTVTFISLNVEVSGSKEVQLVADHSGTAGNVNAWELTDAKLASGTISGFPLKSNLFTISGSNSGTINVDKTGSVSNPKVGQKNATISEFKITSNTEAAVVKRIQLVNGGTVKNSDINNLKLEVNSVKVADGSMTSDGYAVFDFGSGYKIPKGDNKIFKMMADLSGKKDETVKFYQENKTDVLAIGDQFGFGMEATVDTNFDDSTNTHSLTLQGGVLTIAFNGPNATNVGTDTSDTILARYSFSAANDIEVKKLGLVLCKDTDGNGTFDAAADTDSGWSDLDDIKIVDEDTGQVIVGPSNGSNFTVSEATGCPDAVTGAGKVFTDTFDLKAGTTRNFKVTGDIKIANANGNGVALVSTDVIRLVLDGFGESDLVGSSGDVAVMKYVGTNTAVDDSDIVPNTDLGGNNMTLQAASLTLGLASTPGDVTYVKGTPNVDSVGLTFAAALASNLNVTDITLTGYVDDDGTAPFAKVGSNSDSSLTTQGLVSSVKLYDGETGSLISETPQANNLNNSTGTIKFANLNWNIPAGQTKKLLVKVNLSSNSTSGSNDYFAFDIDATTDVTAIDNASKTVNATNADPNGATNPTNVVTVSSTGTLKISTAPSNPIKKAVYWGQTDALFTVYRFRATDEAFLIERLNVITASGGEVVASATANVDKVKVKYTNKAGTAMTAEASLDATNGSASFGFTGDNRPYVPKDSTLDVEIYANIKAKSGRTGTALSTLGSEEMFSLDLSSGATNEFRAIGDGSGTLIEGNNSNIANATTGNNHVIYRVFPEFSQETLAASEPLGTKDILKFKIKAKGLADSRILFDDRASATLRFEVVASGGANSNMTARLYNAVTGELLASQTVTSGQDSRIASSKASVNFNEWQRDFEIAGGGEATFRVELGFTNFTDKSDYLSINLNDTDENNIVMYVDGAKTDEDNSVFLNNTNNGFFTLLPMNGPIFVKQ